MEENIVLLLFVAGPVLAILLLRWFWRAQKKQPAKPGWGTLLLGNLLVLAVLISLIPPAGESYYRFIYNTTDSLVYTKTSRHWMERYWKLNDDNLRDDLLVPMTREAGKRRITFVGDSFTAAHGVKDIQDRFVNLIRRAHPEWEVHMFAVPGFDTWEETDILSFYLKRGYELDLVVLVYCLNDVSDLLPGREENLARINQEIAAQGWLQRNSYLVDTWHHRWQARRDPFIKNYYSFVREGYTGAVWEKQKQRLNDFGTMVRTNGGQVAAVTFPFLHALGANYDYQFAHEELNQYWQTAGVPHLDLLPVYREIPKDQLIVNRLDPHPNEYGHKLAAEAMDKFLQERLKQP
jgi:lysophospholipase L1-like esterase